MSGEVKKVDWQIFPTPRVKFPGKNKAKLSRNFYFPFFVARTSICQLSMSGEVKKVD